MLAQLQYQDSFADDTLHLMGRLFVNQERYTGFKPVNQDALGEWLRQRLGLEWTRAAPSATGAAEEMPLSCPGAERLRELLTLGRIVALKQWARDLARAEPRHGAFARRVEALCKAVDLKGLQRLLDHAEGMASQ